MKIEYTSSTSLDEKRVLISTQINKIIQELRSAQLISNMNDVASLCIVIEFSLKQDASCIQHKNISSKFLIKLTPSSLANLTEVLAHEMCHVAQMLSGNLQIDGNDVLWKGQRYILKDIKHNKRPWEKEAMHFAYKYKSRDCT